MGSWGAIDRGLHDRLHLPEGRPNRAYPHSAAEGHEFRGLVNMSPSRGVSLRPGQRPEDQGVYTLEQHMDELKTLPELGQGQWPEAPAPAVAAEVKRCSRWVMTCSAARAPTPSTTTAKTSRCPLMNGQQSTGRSLTWAEAFTKFGYMYASARPGFHERIPAIALAVKPAPGGRHTLPGPRPWTWAAWLPSSWSPRVRRISGNPKSVVV